MKIDDHRGAEGVWANKCIPETASSLDWIATPPPLRAQGHRIATSTGSIKHDDDPLDRRRLLTASAAADNSQMTCSGGALEEEAGEL